MGQIRFEVNKNDKKDLVDINELLNKMVTSAIKLSEIDLKFKNLKDAENAFKKGNTALTEQEKLLKRTESARKRLSLSTSEGAKEEALLKVQLQESRKALKENAKETLGLVSEHQKLVKVQKLAEAEAKELGATLGKESEEFKLAAKKAFDLKQEIVDIGKATGDTQPNIGRYGEYWRGLVPQLGAVEGALSSVGITQEKIAASGGGIRGFFNVLKTGLVGATKAAIAFITTPIGIAITALAGIGIATKKFFDFNLSVAKTNALIEQLANTSGKATDKLRQQATAISEVYGRDFNESVRELSELQRDFGISSEEAFEIYNKGLAIGGAASNDFGDSIREYGVLFSDAGYSAEEFVNILNAGIDLGFYNDKLPDAIKEAGIELRSEGSRIRKDLGSVLGDAFANDLVTQIDNGSKSIKDAIQEIGDETIKLGLNQTDLQFITERLFISAGEDGGGALKVFEAINVSIDLQTKALTPLQNAYIKSAEIVNDFEKAQTRAFKSDSAVIFAQEAKNAFTEFKTASLNAFSDVRDALTKWSLATEKAGVQNAVTYKSIPKLARAAFEDLKAILKDGARKAIEYGTVIGKALKLDFTGAKSAFNNIKELNTEFGETKKVLAEIAKDRLDAGIAFDKQIEAENKALLAQAEAEKRKSRGDTDSGGGSGFAKREAEETVSIVTKVVDFIENKISQVVNKITGLSFDVNGQVKDIAKNVSDSFIQTIDDLGDAYNKGEITSQQYLDGVEQANKDANDNILADTIAMLEKDLSFSSITAESKEEVEQKLYEFKKQLSEKELAENKARAEKDLETARLSAEQKKKIAFDAAQVAFTIASTIGNEVFQQDSERRSQQLEGAKASKDEEIEYITALEKAGLISKEEADTKRLASTEQLAQKEAQIKRQQAIADKQQALFNAAIDTAAAIVASSAIGYPQAIPGVAAAVALGAVQIGVIASRQIPSFAEGVEGFEGGLARFGEAGPELVELPTGESFVQKSEMIANLPKGTNIYSNQSSETQGALKRERLDLKEATGYLKKISKKQTKILLNQNITVASDMNLYYDN